MGCPAVLPAEGAEGTPRHQVGVRDVVHLCKKEKRIILHSEKKPLQVVGKELPVTQQAVHWIDKGGRAIMLEEEVSHPGETVAHRWHSQSTRPWRLHVQHAHQENSLHDGHLHKAMAQRTR